MSDTRSDPALDTRGPGRFGIAFAAIWLFYLEGPVVAGWQRRDSAQGWLGIIATVAFAVLYLSVFLSMRPLGRRRPGMPLRAMLKGPVGAAVIGLQIVLGVVVCLFVGQAGTATAVYIGVAAMFCLPVLWAWAVAVAVATVTYVATATVAGWQADTGIVFGTLVATLAVWGIQQSTNRSVALLAVREENARLAVEDERNRMARDLHDILGHSLTVITVKAELARRLIDVDTDRARNELSDLERLSRDALTDVRRAVEGYRDLTLPGELARAKIALVAAEIEPHLPNSTDDVPSPLRELFAWTVREGVTNVVRHSGAATCTVRLHPDRVEIEDDGRGIADAATGHGLLGLSERAGSMGAVLVTRSVEPHGFLLQVVAE